MIGLRRGPVFRFGALFFAPVAFLAFFRGFDVFFIGASYSRG